MKICLTCVLFYANLCKLLCKLGRIHESLEYTFFSAEVAVPLGEYSLAGYSFVYRESLTYYQSISAGGGTAAAGSRENNKRNK